MNSGGGVLKRLIEVFTGIAARQPAEEGRGAGLSDDFSSKASAALDGLF